MYSGAGLSDKQKETQKENKRKPTEKQKRTKTKPSGRKLSKLKKTRRITGDNKKIIGKPSENHVQARGK